MFFPRIFSLFRPAEPFLGWCPASTPSTRWSEQDAWMVHVHDVRASKADLDRCAGVDGRHGHFRALYGVLLPFLTHFLTDITAN